LSFDAYSSSGHDLEVSLFQHNAPYANYGISGIDIDLTTSWERVVLTFTTAGFSSAVSNARLMFWLAPYDAAGDKYYIDNVSLAKSSDVTP
jgi:hypothetical protein